MAFFMIHFTTQRKKNWIKILSKQECVSFEIFVSPGITACFNHKKHLWKKTKDLVEKKLLARDSFSLAQNKVLVT